MGCNRAGNNAFFVKTHVNGLERISPQDAFVDSEFRESRDSKGNLTLLHGSKRLELISELPVVSVEDGKLISCRDLA